MDKGVLLAPVIIDRKSRLSRLERLRQIGGILLMYLGAGSLLQPLAAVMLWWLGLEFATEQFSDPRGSEDAATWLEQLGLCVASLLSVFACNRYSVYQQRKRRRALRDATKTLPRVAAIFGFRSALVRELSVADRLDVFFAGPEVKLVARDRAELNGVFEPQKFPYGPAFEPAAWLERVNRRPTPSPDSEHRRLATYG